LGHKFDLSGSRDVVGHVTILYPIGHFILVVLWNGVSISSSFRLRSNHIGVMSLTFQDHMTSLVTSPFNTYTLFLTGCPLEPSLYL